MPRSKTRAIGRSRPENLWGSKAFRARVQRLLYAKIKARHAEEDRREHERAAAQEKAPDLATGGSDWDVILAESAARQVRIRVFPD
jgi:hypothetical protein